MDLAGASSLLKVLTIGSSLAGFAVQLLLGDGLEDAESLGALWTLLLQKYLNFVNGGVIVLLLNASWTVGVEELAHQFA